VKQFTVPQISKYAPLLWIAFGGVLLFWISLEDHGMVGVTLLGTCTAILMTGHFALHHYGGKTLSTSWFVLLCAIIGAASALVITLLMFFKTAWHAHPYPDFPPQMMLDMLNRLPAWAIAGFLAGLGFMLLWYALDESFTV